MRLAERVLAGDVKALARALSLLEEDTPEAAALLAEVRARAGGACIVGITGAPGVGKSTLADGLVREFRRRQERVAVLAVDPSSPFTGGAVLADRVRMQDHANDEAVFIRSMATRGQLGGLSRAAADAAVVLDAAGYGVVLIETVGVGQAEVDVAQAADLSIVVVAPGAGDEIQAMKAGLMEIADIFVINKADREGADRTAAAIEATLALKSWDAAEWVPPVLMTVATSGRGVEPLVEAIARFRQQFGAERASRRSRARRPPGFVLDHVGIAVAEADQVADLLKTLCGLETGPDERVGEYRLRFVETGSAALELVQPLVPDSPMTRFLGDRAAALHHICLRVGDIDAVMAALKAQGVKLVDETPRPGAHGSRIAFIHPASAGGLLIEIKEAAR